MLLFLVINISIHAPTRGATQIGGLIKSIAEFQSTLPREERPVITVIYLPLSAISIHAPTRGATVCPHWYTRPFQPYFNPRSHERSDLAPFSSQPKQVNFNPRSHERSDVFTLPTGRTSVHISIHAPTRGATGKDGKALDVNEFQSTLPREERRNLNCRLYCLP